MEVLQFKNLTLHQVERRKDGNEMKFKVSLIYLIIVCNFIT